MVVFCCSVCCDSLKKNQVQKHYSKCRMGMVSCMDCNQEFWNDDYQQHIKCISEEEKYSGKDYKPKPGQNKGEAKQDAWLQQVQKAIDSSNPSPKLRNLLERMKEYPNIPRKQAKFLNFLKNSLRIYDHKLAESVWEILMPAKPKEDHKENNDDDDKHNNGDAVEGESEKNGEVEGDEMDSKKTKKISKREKKEERRKDKTKQEKKDKNQKITADDDDEKEETGRPAKKKGKKRKRTDDYSEDEEMEWNEVEAKKKKKSHKVQQNDDDDGLPPLEPNPNHAVPEEEASEDEEENNNVHGKKNGLQTKKKKSHKDKTRPAEEEEDDGMSPLEPNSNHACLDETQEEEEMEEDSPPKKKKQKNKKFNWEQTIFALLNNSKEKSMSEKKLRKKVLAEYMDQDGHVESLSILKAKFDRKIKKNRQLVRQKDKVCLRDE